MSVTINKFDPSIAIAKANEEKGKKYRYWIGSDNKLKQQDASGTITIICDLPPGDWHLLFKGSEATEKDMASIVNYHPAPYRGWVDYENPNDRLEYYHKIGSSYLSLLRANGIHLTPQQDVIFIKNNNQ